MQDKGPNLYRRSLYVYRKRTVPHPELATFDAPSREVCQVKRSRTNTPLQALQLLNDVTYVEAARHLARRMLTEGGSSPADRIAFGFRLATARRPTADESAVLMRGLERYRQSFAADAGGGQAVYPQRRQPGGRQTRPGGAGRLPGGGERHSESGRDDHAGMRVIVDALQTAQQLNRRTFLARSGLNLGAMALGSLLSRDQARRGAGRPGRPAALRPESEAGDLPVPVRRPVADRPVRPQAGAGGQARPRPARVDPHGPADHDHDHRPKDAAGGAVHLLRSRGTASPAPG